MATKEQSMADYLVVTSPQNWKTTADLGWTVLGLKSTRRNVASSLRKGDRVACYETGVKRFIAVLAIDGDCFEDHSPIWEGKKDGEDYPYRYPIEPIVVVGAARGLDARARRSASADHQRTRPRAPPTPSRTRSRA